MTRFGVKAALVFCVLLWTAPLAGCKPTLTAAESGKARSKLVAALPGDDEIDSWKREGDPCLARGMEELSMRIDGGAPYYVEKGVIESVFQEYSKGGGAVWVDVVLHRTGTKKQACALYQDLHAEDPVPLAGLADEARSLPNLIGVYALEFRKGKTYASLTVTDTSDESKEALRLFAEYMAAKLP